jgi:hypothetical protein
MGNIIVAANGGRARFKVGDFLGEKQPSRKMTQKELYAMACAAFGPPPEHIRKNWKPK